MILSTKNNYYRWHGHGDNFRIELDPLPVSFNNFFVESCNAAEEIYSLKKGKLYLLYSGGIDSEFALSIFLHLGIEVTPVIIKLNPDYNSHDILYAFKFCEAKGITPLVIDIDFNHFVKSGKIVDIATRLKTAGFPRLTLAHAISKLEGTVLIADHEPTIKIDENKNWNIVIPESDHVIPNYMIEEGIYGTAQWGAWTPEMFISHLSHTRMQDLARNNVPGKKSSVTSKRIIYNEHSNFNLEERLKYHGYEKIIYGRAVPMPGVETIPHKIFSHDSFKEIEKFRKEYDGVFYVDYFDFLKDNGLPIRR